MKDTWPPVVAECGSEKEWQVKVVYATECLQNEKKFTEPQIIHDLSELYVASENNR